MEDISEHHILRHYALRYLPLVDNMFFFYLSSTKPDLIKRHADVHSPHEWRQFIHHSNVTAVVYVWTMYGPHGILWLKASCIVCLNWCKPKWHLTLHLRGHLYIRRILHRHDLLCLEMLSIKNWKGTIFAGSERRPPADTMKNAKWGTAISTITLNQCLCSCRRSCGGGRNLWAK